ncbi:50S ribosomal protein L17 [Marinilabilia salmonicolor]|uniref:50S ribosomal protein L17 n=1 Tax=Marinilabilia salmonicolor TaxID=989 RepID=UPI00029A2252|nr:50S ribosomal protein L17 [Marinilabilia salmonicolor]
MRHRKKFNHLSRTSAHRKAMLSNMASSLIIHKRIKTTVAKAKALRMYVEPLINKSKTDNTHSRRIVFSHLQNKEAVSELFREISEKVASRPGGYTRILKLGNRQGDAAEVCYIELVDYNENMLSETSGAAKKSTRRSRRGAKKSTAETAAPVAEAAEKAPETAKEEPKADDAAEEKKEE